MILYITKARVKTDPEFVLKNTSDLSVAYGEARGFMSAEEATHNEVWKSTDAPPTKETMEGYLWSLGAFGCLAECWIERIDMEAPFDFPRIGVAVILRRGSKILMGQRIGAHGANTWSFPGGHQEMGESPCITAARELYEETGLDAGPHCFKFVALTNDIFSPNKHYVTLFYELLWDDITRSRRGGMLDIEEPELREPDKCAEWRWVQQPPAPLFLPVINLLSEKPQVWPGYHHG